MYELQSMYRRSYISLAAETYFKVFRMPQRVSAGKQEIARKKGLTNRFMEVFNTELYLWPHTGISQQVKVR